MYPVSPYLEVAVLCSQTQVKGLEFKPVVPVITVLRAFAELSQSPSAPHLSCRGEKFAAVLTLRVIACFASHTDDRFLWQKTNAPDTYVN